VPLVRTISACIAASVVGALLFWLEPTRSLSSSLIILTPRWVGPAHADDAIGFQIAAAGLGGASLTAAVGYFAEAVGLATIGVSVLVLTVALLVLFRVVVGQGRRTEATAGARAS